jgi:hypothetical protein
MNRFCVETRFRFQGRSAIVHALMQKAQDLDAAPDDSVDQGTACAGDKIFARAGASPRGANACKD